MATVIGAGWSSDQVGLYVMFALLDSSVEVRDVCVVENNLYLWHYSLAIWRLHIRIVPPMYLRFADLMAQCATAVQSRLHGE